MSAEPFAPRPVITPTPMELAEMLGGILHDGASAPALIQGVATLALAGPDQLSFIAGDAAHKAAAESRAGLLLTSPGHDVPGRARILVSHGEVWPALARLLAAMYPEPVAAGRHSTAVVALSAQVDPTAAIGPHCVVEAEAKIGPGAVLGPHCIVGPGCEVGAHSRLVARVTLVRNVRVGARCLLHPGAVLGADGFKFELTAQGPLKIPQVGGVVLDDDVEIGANTCIDRAFLHETRIGRGVKLDNLVQVGHNVSVGPMTVMAAQVGIAGSAQIGPGCMLAGQVGVGDSVQVGARSILTGQAGVISDVPPGATVCGMPHLPIRQYLRSYAVFTRLPELQRRVAQLERAAPPPAPHEP